MTFANPLYSSVTTHFFDYLTNNINKAFEKRCQELYYKDRVLGGPKKVQNTAESKTLSEKKHSISV